MRKTYRRSLVASSAVSFISLLLMIGVLVPATARASILSDFFAPIAHAATANVSNDATDTDNLQTMALPQGANNFDPSPDATSDVTEDNSALVPQDGPSGTTANIDKTKNGTISVYVVRPGDTLSGIAALFGVSENTIIWANDLSKSPALHSGETLVILPVSGIQYTVKKGDTLESIAKQFSGDAGDIESYNGVDDSSLAVGTTITIPDGEAGASAAPAPTKASTGSKPKSPKASTKVLQGESAACGDITPLANNPAEPSHNVGPAGTCAQIGYYIAPLQPGTYVRTQNIHGYNAVDLAPRGGGTGASILAAADGTVIIARQGGWNGGYGSYVVINHGNGSQTLYAHMSEVDATVGEQVVQGQVIGKVGETGDATGPHVHFEIRGGIRNPF
jgi:murein DD-endopeptidase MepM/ murein hydrolase activator NlpD